MSLVVQELIRKCAVYTIDCMTMEGTVLTHIPEKPLSFEDTAVAFASQSDLALRKKYLIFAAMNSNLLTNVGTVLLKQALNLHLPVKGLIKETIFEQFCGGETIEDSEKTIQELAQSNIGTILDYSVEGEENEKAFEATTREILRTVEKARTTPTIPFCVFKVTGIARFSLLEKVQRGDKLSETEQQSFDQVKERVDRICKAAHDANTRVFIDGEETWIQDVIDQLALEMMKRYNGERPVVYNTYQMYRVDGLQLLRNALHFAVTHQVWLGAKLVRGAYMEKERDRAEEKGYPDPINPNKEMTDDLFNQGLKFCLDHKQRIGMCCGSHNDYSNYYLTMLMEKHGVHKEDPRFFFAQLYGMSDNMSYALAAHGYNVAKYVPYGPVKHVMPYLIRRAQENTAMAGQSSREFNLVRREMNRRGIKLL
nr:proline dehydrogenase family protein [Nafulsella turpanensis]